eukprot:8886678-Alexandrium_andersonii.AAC.1
MVLAKRLHADEGHLAQLANLMTDINASQSSARASASADGGGGAGSAGLVSDVSMVQPGAASADGGGGGVPATPVQTIEDDAPAVGGAGSRGSTASEIIVIDDGSAMPASAADG